MLSIQVVSITLCLSDQATLSLVQWSMHGTGFQATLKLFFHTLLLKDHTIHMRRNCNRIFMNYKTAHVKKDVKSKHEEPLCVLCMCYCIVAYAPLYYKVSNSKMIIKYNYLYRQV